MMSGGIALRTLLKQASVNGIATPECRRRRRAAPGSRSVTAPFVTPWLSALFALLCPYSSMLNLYDYSRKECSEMANGVVFTMPW